MIFKACPGCIRYRNERCAFTVEVQDVKWKWAVFEQADKWGQMGADIPLFLFSDCLTQRDVLKVKNKDMTAKITLYISQQNAHKVRLTFNWIYPMCRFKFAVNFYFFCIYLGRYWILMYYKKKKTEFILQCRLKLIFFIFWANFKSAKNDEISWIGRLFSFFVSSGADCVVVGSVNWVSLLLLYPENDPSPH